MMARISGPFSSYSSSRADHPYLLPPSAFAAFLLQAVRSNYLTMPYTAGGEKSEQPRVWCEVGNAS